MLSPQDLKNRKVFREYWCAAVPIRIAGYKSVRNLPESSKGLTASDVQTSYFHFLHFFPAENNVINKVALCCLTTKVTPQQYD